MTKLSDVVKSMENDLNNKVSSPACKGDGCEYNNDVHQARECAECGGTGKNKEWEGIIPQNIADTIDWFEDAVRELYLSRAGLDLPLLDLSLREEKMKAKRHLVELIAKEIADAKQKTMEEMVELSDKIESQYQTEFNEWKAFKGFRNTMRDKLK